jgi:hypothetical protein
MKKKNPAPASVCPYRLIAEARLPMDVRVGLWNQIQVTINVETGVYSFTHYLDNKTTQIPCRHLKDAMRKFSKALEDHYGPYSGR